MALKDKVKFDLLVDPDDLNTLIIKPTQGLKENSVYTINIKDLQLEQNFVYSDKQTFITAPDDYFYVSVAEVKEIVHGLDLPDESIARHIVAASKTASYWARKHFDDINGIVPDFKSETFKEDYYPFYMYIKFTAMVNSLREFYIELITNPKKWKDTLSDLAREEEMDFDSIRKLIDDLEKESEDWLDLVVTITADPKWALRGKYSYVNYNTNSHPYHKITWYYRDNYDRGF
jgi:hypothetical protein